MFEIQVEQYFLLTVNNETAWLRSGKNNERKQEFMFSLDERKTRLQEDYLATRSNWRLLDSSKPTSFIVKKMYEDIIHIIHAHHDNSNPYLVSLNNPLSSESF